MMFSYSSQSQTWLHIKNNCKTFFFFFKDTPWQYRLVAYKVPRTIQCSLYELTHLSLNSSILTVILKGRLLLLLHFTIEEIETQGG